MSDRFSCAASSRERDEELAGTASTAQRWLAVEQPGAWGSDALLQSRMAPRTARGLAALGRRRGLRVVLLRRHGRDADDGPRTAFVASTGTGSGIARAYDFDDPAELLDLDLDDDLDGGLQHAGDGGPPHGRPVTEPVYLVCTHGAHDACCAEFGRSAAAALVEAAGDRAWECSHVGGDRFAANVVVLPHGVYHGRVTAADAAGLVERHDAGRTVLHSYRGRTRHPFVVQFAEASLRRHLDEDRLDAVRVPRAHRRDGNIRTVSLAVGDARFEVDVVVGREAPAQLTCRADGRDRAPSFEVREIRTV